MVKSMYAAVAGLKSHQTKMDVISNNIANVNTWGFKSQTTSFKDSMYQNNTVGSAGAVGVGSAGGTNTSQIGFGVNVGAISVNYTTGAWSPTGRSLDCMINGSGFFLVGPMQDGSKTDNGTDTVAGIKGDSLASSNLKLSKVGIFAVDGNGYLVDDQGNYVYGYQGTWDDTNKSWKIDSSSENARLVPIRIPSKSTKLENGNVSHPAEGTDENSKRPIINTYKIGDDGKIVGTTETGDIVTIGQIAVASVENVNGLEHDQGYYYTPGANVGKISGGATTISTGKILSGYLEMSNVDLAKEMSDMITTQRGYQANTKIITVTDEMLSELVSMKR